MIKDRMVQYYMDVAQRTAELSYAVKLKVGSIIVKDNKIISIGYNGTPSGWSNECENQERVYDIRDTFHSNDWKREEKTNQFVRLKTKDEVIHAELNCISKLARSSESGEGAVMFITHSPCIQCAKAIYTAGIKSIYYKTEYRSEDGLKFLESCGLNIIKINGEKYVN